MFHLFICYFDLTQHRRLHAVLYTVNKRTISRSIEAKRWVHTTRAQRTIWKYVLTTILYFTVSDSKERTTLHALIHVVVGRKKISMIIQFMAMLTAYTSCSRLIESRRSVAVCLPAKAYYVIKSMYPHAKQRDETEHAPRLLHEKASRFPLIAQSPRLSWSRNRFMLDEDKQKRRISKPGGDWTESYQDGVGSSRECRAYLSKGVYSKNFILGALWTHKRVDLRMHARQILQTNSKLVCVLGQIRIRIA